jgi:hypothetical protein
VGWNWSVPDSCCHLESPGCEKGFFLSAVSNCLVFTVLRTSRTTMWGITGLYLTPAPTWTSQGARQASSSQLCLTVLYSLDSGLAELPCGLGLVCTRILLPPGAPRVWGGLFLSALSNCHVFTVLMTGGTTLWGRTGLYMTPAATWSPQGVGRASSSLLCLTVLYSLYSGLAELICGAELVCT